MRESEGGGRSHTRVHLVYGRRHGTIGSVSDAQPPADSFWGGIPEDPATEPDLAPTAGEHRVRRGVGEFFGDVVGEAVLAGLSLALLAGVLAAATYGWKHDRTLVIGIAVAIGCFLVYGVWHLVQAARKAAKPRWPRPAAAAAGTVVAVDLWATYILIYH
jgi:hypothetical protein